MKIIMNFALIASAAFIFAACGGTADNRSATNDNEAANTAARPAAAAPTADALLALDKQANEAYFKGDAKFFEDFLSDKFVEFSNGGWSDKAAAVKMIAGNKCDIKEGWELEDPQIAMIDADTYALSYKGTFDGSCTGTDGKSMKAPSPIRAATVYVKSGDKWLAAFHGENLIIDPKNPPPAPAKPEAAKKEEPKADDAKKEESAESNSAAPAPAKPVADANTEALVKIHTSGWEAFKAKDAKKFEEISTKDLSNLDPAGNWLGGQAAVIKQWTETMKCEGITKVAVTDGVATALSPTVEILRSTGNADGTCDGQKNGDLYQTSFYVKDGDAWKLAFMFESMAR